MSDPLIDPSDLSVYLNDATINEARAELMIAIAQTLCESIVSPLPPAAYVVVMRVAGRGYVSTTSTRSAQIAAAGSPFVGGGTGCELDPADRADLRRMASNISGSGGGAFSIDILPVGYVAPVTARSPLSDWDAPA